jgi:hypothetical protein
MVGKTGRSKRVYKFLSNGHVAKHDWLGRRERERLPFLLM